MTRAPTLLQLLGTAIAVGIFGACATQATSPEPEDDTTGPPKQGGTGGSGLAGGNTGGQTPATAGTGGATPSTGGTPSGSAGASSAGTAGSGTAGGSGVAGSGTTVGGCPMPPAVGTATDVVIDDLEDRDNAVSKVSGRTGFWFTYLDTLGSTITPAPDKTGTSPLMPSTTSCHGGMACVAVSGTTGASDAATNKYPFAGVGFDFSNVKKSCPYNASAYSGVRFWARGAASVRIKVVTAAVADAASGGSCATSCNDAFGMNTTLTAAWSEVSVPFATPMIAQEGWGAMATFDKATLLAVQIQITSGQTFDLAFDDIAFY